MTEVKWIVDQQMEMVRQGGCPYMAAVGIMNALALSETETMDQYHYAQQALKQLFVNKPEGEILCRMLNNIIQDEGDHDASFKKAAAIISGYKEAKPEEYNKAVKRNDTDTV